MQAHVSLAAAIGCASFALVGGARAQCPPLTQTVYAADVGDDRSFGVSVAFDSAASSLLVGAETDDAPANDCGATYVFRSQGGAWTMLAKLQAADASATARFGHDVDVSANGTIASIGAVGDDALAADAGAVYVFADSGGAWHQVAKLVASDHDAGDAFGRSVALNADGTLAVIGASDDDLGGVDAGAAYVWVDPGFGWIEAQKLVPPAGSAGWRFGSGVDASASGDVLAIGARGGDRVLVYRRIGSLWKFETTLVASFAVSNLGKVVELDASGDVVLAGASFTNSFAGNAALWRRSGGAWGAAVELAASPPKANDFFGSAVALDASGTRAVVGAFGDATSIGGSTHVFEFDGASWSVTAVLASSASAVDGGTSVACSADGRSIASGDPLGALGNGLVDVHRFVDAPVGYCTAKPNSLGCTPTLAFSGCPSATSGSGFVVTASQVLSQKQGVFFYGTSGAQAVPFQGGWLCAHGPLKRIALQSSGGHPPPSDCSGSFTVDFNAHAASGSDPALVAGAAFAGQWWSRDPAASFGTSLTGAVRGTLGP
ncbi:MAG: hypothetical protein IT453_06180 [Planctomycetes bacterium]|nr:hypothetical protein [Planctomycetota bacterium]